MLTIYGSNNRFLPDIVVNLKYLLRQRRSHLHTAIVALELQNLIVQDYPLRYRIRFRKAPFLFIATQFLRYVPPVLKRILWQKLMLLFHSDLCYTVLKKGGTAHAGNQFVLWYPYYHVL